MNRTLHERIFVQICSKTCWGLSPLLLLAITKLAMAVRLALGKSFKMRGVPILEQLQLEELLLRTTEYNWYDTTFSTC